MTIENKLISDILLLLEKDDKKSYLKVEEILKEHKINPCEIITGDANYTLLASGLLHYGDKAFSLLLKYSDETKTPPQARSPWTTAIFVNKLSVLKKLAKIGTSTINAPTGIPNVPSNFSHFVKRSLPKPNLKDVKIKQLVNEKTAFLLDSGADINTYLEDNHVCLYWLRYLTHKPALYEEILTFCLKYNFDSNIKYHHNTDNNFLQHFFIFVATKDNKSWQDKILTMVLDKNSIDFDYKNKEGQNIIDVLQSRRDKNNISEECITRIENIYLNEKFSSKTVIAAHQINRL